MCVCMCVYIATFARYHIHTHTHTHTHTHPEALTDKISSGVPLTTYHLQTSEIEDTIIGTRYVCCGSTDNSYRHLSF